MFSSKEIVMKHLYSNAMMMDMMMDMGMPVCLSVSNV